METAQALLGIHDTNVATIKICCLSCNPCPASGTQGIPRYTGKQLDCQLLPWASWTKSHCGFHSTATSAVPIIAFSSLLCCCYAVQYSTLPYLLS